MIINTHELAARRVVFVWLGGLIAAVGDAAAKTVLSGASWPIGGYVQHLKETQKRFANSEKHRGLLEVQVDYLQRDSAFRLLYPAPAAAEPAVPAGDEAPTADALAVVAGYFA